MIYYNYRWYLVAFISMLLQIIGYFYLLKMPMDEMQILRKKEQTLMGIIQRIHVDQGVYHKRVNLKLNERNQVVVKRPQNEFDVMTEIIELFNQHHLNIISISPLSRGISSPNFISLNITTQAYFQDFLTFLLATKEQSDFIQIADFSSQLMSDNSNRLTMIMTLWLVKKQKFQNEKSFKSSYATHSQYSQQQIFCPTQGFHLSS